MVFLICVNRCDSWADSQHRLALKRPDRVQFANTPISLLSRILELGRYLHLAR